ncbi:MAG TPA: gliding motility-associated C-terminal domain-containing protein, partial [Flavisolibacter sp.]
FGVNFPARNILLALMLLLHTTGMSQEICNNGIDDDLDGRVDLNDDDCTPTAFPILRNPSFEKIIRCPVSYSQLQYAAHWMQPAAGAAGSTDLYQKCECGSYEYITLMDRIPLPPPDGTGFAGIFDIRNWMGQGRYKENVTTCSLKPLLKDSFYVFDFYTGFLSGSMVPQNNYHSYTPVSLSIYGHPSCGALPYGSGSDSTWRNCPVAADPAWVELAQVSVSGGPGQWVRTRVEFKAPKNIMAFVIGPSCGQSPYGGPDDWSYYLLDQLLVYKKEAFDIPLISRAGDVCAGTLTLTAQMGTVPEAWQWYRDGIALPGETGAQLQVTRYGYGAGDYSVRAAIGGKTWLSPETIVAINDVQFYLRDTIAFCGDSTVLLQPDIPGTICPYTRQWQDGSAGTAFTATSPGLSWFETDKEGCRFRDTVYVISHAGPAADLGADTILCPGDDVVLQAGNPGMQYLWQDFSTGASFTVTQEGTYHVRVSDAWCTDIDTVRVRYDRLPEIHFSADTILCENEQKLLAPEVYATDYLWSTGSTAPAITISMPGTYLLQASNPCGVANGSVNIVASPCNLLLPTAFTPNGDGLNDHFGPVTHRFMMTFDMKVFNRWGQLVFETPDPSRRWDGTFRGKHASMGVYAWVVSYTDAAGRQRVARGTVVLIR